MRYYLDFIYISSLKVKNLQNAKSQYYLNQFSNTLHNKLALLFEQFPISSCNHYFEKRLQILNQLVIYSV